MDPFGAKEITIDQLKTVTELVTEMKKLGLGNGFKKDAKLSKIKDQLTKDTIIGQANTLEAEINNLFPDTSIIAILEVARRFRKKYESIARDQIPSMLSDIGLNSLELHTGEKLVVKNKLEASIPDKNYMLARSNMIKYEVYDRMEERTMEEHIPEDQYDGIMEEISMEATESIDSLFKKKLIIEDPKENVKELLLENDIPYDNKYSIAWQTLRKYCNNQLAKGKSIPEGINVFEYSEAEIK